METKILKTHLARKAVGLLAVLSLITAFFSLSAFAEQVPVIVNSMPSNLPSKYISSDFTVTASNTNVPVYVSGENAWGNNISYATFDANQQISISVTANFAFNEFELLPHSQGKIGTKTENTISFTALPGENITIIFDGNYNGKALHIFVNTFESEALPDPQNENVLYFQPGYYDLADQGPIMLKSNQIVYIAGGAIVRARFLCKDVSNVTIKGHGILINDFLSKDGYDPVAIALKNSSDITIKDIIVARDMNAWTAFMWKCNNVTVTNYKSINAKYASSDGFNIANSHDVLFSNVFVRSCDDSVAIKGTGNNGYNYEDNPATARPTYNIRYENSQLWSDANNAIGIGAETIASYFDNIVFSNIDILRNYDDLNYPDQLTDRSAINICALNATTIQNVTFENIRVESAKRLIGITMEDSFWFGSLPGNWNWTGVIKNINYKNISSTSNGTNQIRITGRDSEHLIQDVTFENIMVNQKEIDNFNNELFHINTYAKNIKLVSTNNQAGIFTDGPIYPTSAQHNAAEQFSTTQGENNWYYRIWEAGVGTNNMVWNADESLHWRGSKQWDAIWCSDHNLYFHPDTTQVILDWISPRSGNINVTGNVKKYATNGGDGVNVSIWKNNQMIWPVDGAWKTIAYNNSQGVDASITTTVNQGDTLSFRVDKNGDTSYDTTQWTPVITFID